MDFLRRHAPRWAEGPAARGPRTVRAIRLALACLLLAALSALVVAPAPAYDPWSWLLWGREVAHGTLSTSEGPAFKPLPVAVTALLAPLGGATAVVWVVLARAAALGAVALAFVVARRLAGPVAGALAAAGVALCGASPTYAASGDVTGLLLALTFGGLLLWQRGAPGLALACAVGCALLRVEAWPFVLVLAVVLWRRDRRLRPALVVAALAVPAAWFVPEWLGSGDLLRSSARARIPNPGQPALADVPALASLRAAAGLPLWPLLVAGAVAALAAGARRGPYRAWRRAATVAPSSTVRALAAAGVAWVVVVAVMAQAGFSGEPRYALPGAALLAVAGAAVLAGLPRPALAVAALLVAAAAVPRLADLPDLRADQAHQWRLATDLTRAIAGAGGRDAVLRCGTPYAGPFRGPLLAYRLGVPKDRVEPDMPPEPPGTVFRSRLKRTSPVQPGAAGFPTPRRVGAWQVHALCR